MNNEKRKYRVTITTIEALYNLTIDITREEYEKLIQSLKTDLFIDIPNTEGTLRTYNRDTIEQVVVDESIFYTEFQNRFGVDTVKAVKEAKEDGVVVRRSQYDALELGIIVERYVHEGAEAVKILLENGETLSFLVHNGNVRNFKPGKDDHLAKKN